MKAYRKLAATSAKLAQPKVAPTPAPLVGVDSAAASVAFPAGAEVELADDGAADTADEADGEAEAGEAPPAAAADCEDDAEAAFDDAGASAAFEDFAALDDDDDDEEGASAAAAAEDAVLDGADDAADFVLLRVEVLLMLYQCPC